MYNLVVAGGTFDHFHKGHAAFLRAILDVGQKILLGITSDKYTDIHKSNYTIQPFIERRNAVETFLSQEKVLDRVAISPIDTVLYPLEWESLPIDAIVVTKETKKGGESINNDRKVKGLPELPIHVVSLLPDDTGEKLASTNIRGGKINTEGISYVKPSWFAQDLLLPEIEKQWFKKPFGTLYQDNTFLLQENPEKIVTVGDAVTKDANALQLHQKVSIVDFTIQRKHIFQQIQELGFTGNELIMHAKNPASHITTELFQTIMQALSQLSGKKEILIVVDGEEDLAVIPLVLALPLGFIVVYGQPNEGIVRLEITSAIKDFAYQLLQKFVTIRGI